MVSWEDTEVISRCRQVFFEVASQPFVYLTKMELSRLSALPKDTTRKLSLPFPSHNAYSAERQAGKL